MKTLITLTLILSSFFCFGQKKESKEGTTTSQCSPCPGIYPLDTISTPLSKLERAKYLNYESFIKEAGKVQQDHYKFLGEYSQANGIDPHRVSIHPDSLKYLPPDAKNPNGKFLFILKSKKK